MSKKYCEMYGLMAPEGKLVGIDITSTAWDDDGCLYTEEKFDLSKYSNEVWLTDSLDAANFTARQDPHPQTGKSYHYPENYYKDLRVVKVSLIIEEIDNE